MKGENYCIIKYFTTKKIKILDVDVAQAFVEAKDISLDCIGIDLNPSAIEFGQKRGLELYVKDIFDITNQRFDVITLFDVLEHLINPSEIIHKTYELLNSGV